MTTYENVIRVLRDDEEILSTTDDSIKDGSYAGMIGLKAVGAPTYFDVFFALRWGGPYVQREWAATMRRFPGPNVNYWPIYFEQFQLERYGHHLGNMIQPIFSHGFFFLDVLGLPYSIGKTCPWDCLSNDGYFKPGDVVLPMRIVGPELDLHGITMQTVVTALVFSLVP